MAKARISIIVPNYNYAEFLGVALESVIAQTREDWELIVVDNFSTDDSQQLVDSFGDPRIKFVQFANEGVIARSRNYGISKSQGEYIAFLDSDDYWRPRKLEIQVHLLESGFDLSYHDLRLFGSRLGRFRSWRLNNRSSLTHLLSGGNPIATSSVLVRAKIASSAGGFPENEDLISAEDYALWLSIANRKAKFIRAKTILGGYRVHNSVSSQRDTPRAAQLAAEPYLGGQPNHVLRGHQGFMAYARGVRFYRLHNHRSARIEFIEAITKGAFRYKWRAALRVLWLVFYMR